MTLFRTALPIVAAAAALAACAAVEPAPAGPIALTPTEQFMAEVRSTPDEILLAPNGPLSAAQDAALADLAERWRDAGEGPVVIGVAGGGRATHTAHAAARALQGYGVPKTMVRVEPGEGAVDGPPPPVRVGYSRLVAVGPQCANLWGDLTRTANNGPHAAFGCAVTANMAVQIADPRDLVAPRASYPADAVRRATVLEKYRKGETTGAKRGDDERGDVRSTSK